MSSDRHRGRVRGSGVEPLWVGLSYRWPRRRPCLGSLVRVGGERIELSVSAVWGRDRHQTKHLRWPLRRESNAEQRPSEGRVGVHPNGEKGEPARSRAAPRWVAISADHSISGSVADSWTRPESHRLALLAGQHGILMHEPEGFSAGRQGIEPRSGDLEAPLRPALRPVQRRQPESNRTSLIDSEVALPAHQAASRLLARSRTEGVRVRTAPPASGRTRRGVAYGDRTRR